jgi:tetratricopeptide (TPR) repeat protein
MLECLNLTQAYWSPLFLALEEFLVSRSGFLAFFHDYMRQAVEKRYSRIPNFFNDLRRLMTGYWNTKAATEMAAVRTSKDKLSPLAQRAFEEIPFHYEAASDMNSLRTFISKPSHFRALAGESFRFDLVRYVRSCDGAVAIKNSMQSLSDISDMETTASFFKELGSYDIAEEFYAKALTAAEKLRNEGTLADVLDGLGYVQRLRGKYVEAAKTLDRCLELKRRLLKEDDGSLATSINNLAIVLRKQGKYERAEELYNNALAIRLKIFGSTHADVAQSYNSLGCLYQDQGKFEIAEKNLLEAIRLRELLLGSGHPDLAMSLFNVRSLSVPSV